MTDSTPKTPTEQLRIALRLRLSLRRSQQDPVEPGVLPPVATVSPSSADVGGS